jgi:two-component system, response regulator PdtaR
VCAAVAKVPQGHAVRSTILVVEDEALVRLWIADELRTAGFLVIEGVSADEALTVLRGTIPIDLVMTDVRMPGSLDGLGLAETVRALWPDLKIILCSGDPPTSPDERSLMPSVPNPTIPQG